MKIINLTKGITENEDYKAWKFPGGEIGFKPKAITGMPIDMFSINTRLNTSDDILLLCIVVDTLKYGWINAKITVNIPYFPYAQADRRFEGGEAFALKTICNILNTLPVDWYEVFDPHSDVTSGLLKNCYVKSNSEFIKDAISQIDGWKNLVLISPDAGAYKKIFKLANEIGFNGQIECCNKYRHLDGSLQVRVPDVSFKDKNILIIDDICVGGKTFTELMKAINENGTQHGMYKDAYLAVSHGIFSNMFGDLSKYFKKIFVTNSRKDSWQQEINWSVESSKQNNLLSIYKII